MAEFDEILLKYVPADREATNALLGAAFIVKDKDGRTLYSNAIGKLNFESNSPPFTVDSVGWIASMTKLVTAVSVMQLVEKGMIELDDDLGNTVPYLSSVEILKGFDDQGAPVMIKKSKPITLRHLLTHSSGLAYDGFDPDIIRWSTAVRKTNSASLTLDEYKLPLKFEPGDGWVYGVGLDWAGHVVEVLTGDTLENYMKEHIFGPLGMPSTTFYIAKRPDLAERRAAVGFRAIPRGPLMPGADPLPESPAMASGGSGLYSTASDYAKLLSALLKSDDRILKMESVRELCKPQLLDNKYLMATFDSEFHDIVCCEYPRGLQANYGLGGAVNLEDVPEKRPKGSLMWSGMSNPHWWLDLETGITATMFTQVIPPGDGVVNDLYDELERAVYRQAGR